MKPDETEKYVVEHHAYAPNGKNRPFQWGGVVYSLSAAQKLLAQATGRRPELPWEIHKSTGEVWGTAAWGWLYEKFVGIESGSEVSVPVSEMQQ